MKNTDKADKYAVDYQFTHREKLVAQIVDKLCPIIVEDGHHVGPELFKKLTLRLTELIPYPSDWKAHFNKKNL